MPIDNATVAFPTSERTPLLEPSNNAPLKSPNSRTHTYGLIVVLVLGWVMTAQGEASQALQASANFNKPFFIVGFNHTITVVLLPLAYMYHRINDGSGKTDVVSVLQRHSVLPLAKLVRMAAFLNAFYCVSDYFWFRALANISVAMGGAIFNTSPLSVYCFSICFLHERASLRKLAGVLTAFAGVSLIIFFQDDGSGAAAPSSSPEGASFLASFLVLIAATIYAGYEVAVRVVIGEDVHDLSTLVILTGLCGVFTIPIWTIGSLLLAWSPFPSFYEPLGWPETSEGIAYLMLSGSLAGVLTLLLSIALCWTSPLETSVGGMLGLPASVIWDMVAHSMRFPWPCFVGSVFVMAGFALLEFASIRAMIQTKLLQPKRSEPVP